MIFKNIIPPSHNTGISTCTVLFGEYKYFKHDTLLQNQANCSILYFCSLQENWKKTPLNANMIFSIHFEEKLSC